MTRNVTAEGLANDFDIEGDSGSGPLGDAGGRLRHRTHLHSSMVIVEASSPGSSRQHPRRRFEHAGLFGLALTTAGVTSGTAPTEWPRASSRFRVGITALIGSNNYGGNILDAGTVPGVALDGRARHTRVRRQRPR